MTKHQKTIPDPMKNIRALLKIGGGMLNESMARELRKWEDERRFVN